MRKIILVFFICALIVSCSRKDTDIRQVDYRKSYPGFWKGTYDDGGETGSLTLLFRDNGTLRFYNFNTADTAMANYKVDGSFTVTDNRFIADVGDGLILTGQLNKEGNILTGEMKKNNYFYVAFVITKQQ